MNNARRLVAAIVLALALASGSASAQLTLETGEIGEVFFTWQGELSDAGATAHSLSRMNAFRTAYESGWLQSVEILEITELNTNQSLPFSYVLPSGEARSMPDLQDVVWYYPNPIPSGGNVRLLVRGRLVSEAVYRGDSTRIEFSYASNDEVLFVLPIGYAVTYSSNPIIVYEKDLRTVASFPRTNGRIALTAKDARMFDDALSPVNSCESRAGATPSDHGLSVSAVHDEALLEYARNRVNGAITSPVLIEDVQAPSRIRTSDRDYVVPGRTVVWSINDEIVDGPEEFERLDRQLPIGYEAVIGIIMLGEEGQVTGSRTIRITAAEER